MTTILYDDRTREQWLEELQGENEWVKRHLFALFSIFGTPKDSLDVGCGTGILTMISRSLGISCFGVDQLVADEWPEFFMHHNLETPFSLQQSKGVSTVEHVYCFEVAEHLKAEAHPILCDTIANHLGKGGRLFFSAAHPGQGGNGHLAERPAKYWQTLFYERGLNFMEEKTTQLRLSWMNIKSPLYWLPANLMVFER